MARPLLDFASVNVMAAHLLRIDDVLLLTLKAHALAEAKLRHIVYLRLSASEDEIPTFSYRVWVQVALAGYSEEPWPRVKAALVKLGSIRNALAHEVLPKDPTEDMKELYEGLALPVGKMPVWPPEKRLQIGTYQLALGMILGYLSALQETVKGSSRPSNARPSS